MEPAPILLFSNKTVPRISDNVEQLELVTYLKYEI